MVYINFFISIFSLVRSSGPISIPYFLVLLFILGPSCWGAFWFLKQKDLCSEHLIFSLNGIVIVSSSYFQLFRRNPDHVSLLMYPQGCSYRCCMPTSFPFSQNIDSAYPSATPGLTNNYISIYSGVKLESFYYMSNTLILTSHSSLWCISKYKKQRRHLKVLQSFFHKRLQQL